jgi:hypothetical protein
MIYELDGNLLYSLAARTLTRAHAADLARYFFFPLAGKDCWRVVHWHWWMHGWLYVGPQDTGTSLWHDTPHHRHPAAGTATTMGMVTCGMWR